MLPQHRVVTTIPLRELWNDQGPLPMRRVRALSASDVRELMRLGLKDFCVADVDHPLEWLDPVSPYEFLKHEVLPRLLEPASAKQGFSLDDCPGGYAYLASEWQDDAGGKAVLFEKYH